jgi:hypothetical protein
MPDILLFPVSLPSPSIATASTPLFAMVIPRDHGAQQSHDLHNPFFDLHM